MDANILRHPAIALKIAEVLLLIIILALYFSQLNVADVNFMTSVFVGSFLNAIVLLTVRLLGYNQIQSTPLELILYVFYVVCFLVSSILLFTGIFSSWKAAGVFCLLVTLVYGVEWYYAFIALNGHPPSLTLVQTPNQQTASSQSDTIDCAEPHDVSSYQTGYQQQNLSDGVDAGFIGHGINYQTNPTYPPTMNYPPHNYTKESNKEPRP
ncbi:uncharacterized protein [Palaemon carinicauda]|uniref:uncharacterized protein isoform X1 n=1 Tax=Palaemon carinicauda TaxID=392227 RepID=UPI0035B58D3E